MGEKKETKGRKRETITVLQEKVPEFPADKGVKKRKKGER